MPNFRKAWIVGRFELREALRSRLVALVLLVYGAGAAAGSWLFLKALNAASEATERALGDLLENPSTELPQELGQREQLADMLASFVSDPALRERLLGMDPLAIFYGFAALNLVSGVVLVTSGATHSTDLQTGAARFVLARCDRLTWAFGKMLGHAVLLAVGLVTGAVTASAVALGTDSKFEAMTMVDLLVTSSWAWLYGFAYLGIFSGLSLSTRQPGRARLLGVLALFGLWVAHGLTGAEVLTENLPGFAYLAWLFPAQYESLLWSPNAGWVLLAAVALFAIGLGAFWLGERVFQGRDA